MPSDDLPLRPTWRDRMARASLATVLWLLMLPSLVGLIIFTYLPNLESVRKAFYKWDGGSVDEFRGLDNFREAFTADPFFWNTFGLILILLAANLVKMWPSIFGAIVLHRLKSERSQYLYRVLFVIPMVIPGLVMLLLWKTFFDANVGLFNVFLHATGLMGALSWLDHAWPALTMWMRQDVLAWNPANGLAANLAGLPFKAIPLLFGGLLGLAVWGAVLLLLGRGLRSFARLWLVWPLVAALALLAWGADGLGSGPTFALATILRSLPLAIAAWGLVSWLHHRDRHLAPGRIAAIGWGAIGTGVLLLLLSQVWTAPSGAFDAGRPAWLGHPQLVLPAVILWGFPWIGTIGVLIYLAGLSNISQEVYEAAELDGVGFWGKIFKIEIPLIMTQVRINLIFMTIGTLGDYAFFLILLGPSGGPNGVGLTPGLYMYQQAFINGRMGYACALGMLMFLLILYITVIYQRHVKVER